MHHTSFIHSLHFIHPIAVPWESHERNTNQKQKQKQNKSERTFDFDFDFDFSFWHPGGNKRVVK